MIYGKTYKERREAEHNRLLDIRNGLTNGWTKFAFLPVTLNNGRKIWLQTYYEFYYVCGDDKNLWTLDCPHSGKPVKYHYETREEGLNALH